MRRLSLLIFASVSVLLSLAACGGTSTTSTSSSTGSSAATTATTVQVMETEYKISSSLTSFVPGKAYHFVVTNNGAAAHEFMTKGI
jgi:Na+/H+-dicarboxylate symporter